MTGKRGRQMARTTLPDPAGLFDRAHWLTATEDVATTLYGAITTAAGTSVADKFNTRFSPRLAVVRAFIIRRAKQLAGRVTDTTYRDITKQLAEGATAGEGIPLLAARVTRVFDVATTSRAKMIARTEVISAYNGATEVAARALPADVVGGKEWIATHDTRTREAHTEADGQTVSVDAPFLVAGVMMAYPGDPAAPPELVINCRCTLAYLTPDEMTERGQSPASTHMSAAEAGRLLRVIVGGAA